MRRPAGITLLSIFYILLAAWNGMRFYESFAFAGTLRTYAAHPAYLAATGGIWCLAGLLLAWSLWRRKSWGRWAAIGGSLAYIAWYWLDRSFLQAPHANWLFALAVTVATLVGISGILFTPRSREYFKRVIHE
jgi:uncharacterized protein (TIGR03382 family)